MAFELFPVVQWFDNSGNPLAGGLISTFIAGTTTPQATFTDSTGGTPQANPVVLDSAGRAQIWFAAASYKLVLKTAAGVTLMTIDNVTLDNLAATISSLSMTGALTMQQSTVATNVANQSSNVYSLQGTYWNGAASANDTWTFQNILGGGTNPTSTLTIAHSGSPGTPAISFTPALTFNNVTVNGSQAIAGSLAVTGNVTEIAGQNQYKGYSFNNVLCVDGNKYTTLAAAYADLPSSSGLVIVYPNQANGTYTETLAADITMKHDSGFLFMCPAFITMGTHQFKCAGGTANGFFINSQIPFGSAGSPSAGVIFTYTGTTTPFSFGDTTTDSFQLSLKNFAVNITGAGAAAVGITLNRFHPYTFENLRIIGVVGQIGIKMDGTGGYTGDGVLINMFTNGLTSGIQMFNNGNNNQIIGGNFPNTAAGGKGIDILNGNGNLIFGADIENATIGVNIASNANNFGNRCWIYGQGNGTDFVIGALATGNIVDNIGANNGSVITSVTDSGTGNSVTNPFKLKSDVNGKLSANGGVTAGVSGGAGGGGTAALLQTIAASNASIGFQNTAGAADSKNWDILSSASDWSIRAGNDANNGANTAILINRGSGFTIANVTFHQQTIQDTPNTAQWIQGQNSELLTLSTVGATTDTAGNLLPANAIIESVVARVTTTITTATDWKLGDATTAGRFAAANATMTAGATSVGTVMADQTGAAGPRQTAAAKVRVTTTGTPGAGVIRITVFYRQFVAPGS